MTYDPLDEADSIWRVSKSPSINGSYMMVTRYVPTLDGRRLEIDAERGGDKSFPRYFTDSARAQARADELNKK